MPLKVRKSRIIEITKSAIIVKKVILLKIVLNFQKASVDLSNLYVGD